jgi:hypothetical protein
MPVGSGRRAGTEKEAVFWQVLSSFINKALF